MTNTRRAINSKYFGSFGNNETEINLDKHNFVLVSGNNGHGKSFALLDSITFALFGKPFRKINIPQLNGFPEKYSCLLLWISIADVIWYLCLKSDFSIQIIRE